MSTGKIKNKEIEKLVSTHVELLRKLVPELKLRSIYDHKVYTSLLVDDIQEFLYAVDKGGKGKILDFGCGRGTLSNALSEVGYDVTGVDIEVPKEFNDRTSYVLDRKTQESVWKKTVGSCEGKLDFLFYGGGKLPLKDNQFDAVFAYAVLEHVEDLELSLSELSRVTKKDGTLFISRTPIKYSYVEKFSDLMGIPAHENKYSEEEITKLVENAGFKIESIEKIDFFPSNIPFSKSIDSIYQRTAGLLFLADKIIRKTSLSSISHHFRIVARKC